MIKSTPKKMKNFYFDNAVWAEKATRYRETWLIGKPDYALRDEVVEACMIVSERMLQANHFARAYYKEMDELKQECYLKITRDIHLFRFWVSPNPKASLFSYISRITKNHILTWEKRYKRKRSREVLCDDMEFIGDSNTTELRSEGSKFARYDWTDFDESG